VALHWGNADRLGRGRLAVLVEMLTNGRYGYFRDELYYLAASDHLAFGYVDFAPLIAWAAHASRLLIGDSLHAVRLMPALAFGGEVLLAGAIARELGGRRWAVLTACAAVLSCPVILANGGRFGDERAGAAVLDGLCLRAAGGDQPEASRTAAVVRRAAGGWVSRTSIPRRSLWRAAVGLLAPRSGGCSRASGSGLPRRSRVVIALPNVVWQYQHHFPTLEDLRNVKALHKNVELPPLAFMAAQILMLNPLALWCGWPGWASCCFIGKESGTASWG